MVLLLVTLASLLFFATLIGGATGYKAGRRGVRVGTSCSKAWLQAFWRLTIATFLLAPILFDYDLFEHYILSWATVGTFLINLLIGGWWSAISAIPAPIAAFIAHNFGTQRRIRDELSQPPE